MVRAGRLTALALLASASFAVANAADHPDFSGVWTNYRPGAPPVAGQLGQIGGAPAAGAAGAAAPAGGARAARPRDATGLPIKPEAAAKIAAYRTLVTPAAVSPGTFCLGTGMPGSMSGSGGYPMEIIQRPELLGVTYEAHTEIRRIYVDPKLYMAEPDRVPGRNGYSQARWEGNVLVVETDTLKEQVDQRYAHSDQAKIVERYHLEKEGGQDVLVADWVMTDPVFYTEPVGGQKKWSKVADGHLLPYECAEEGWELELEKLAGEQKKTASNAAPSAPRN
jgi:hypothetical protein